MRVRANGDFIRRPPPLLVRRVEFDEVGRLQSPSDHAHLDNLGVDADGVQNFCEFGRLARIALPELTFPRCSFVAIVVVLLVLVDNWTPGFVMVRADQGELANNEPSSCNCNVVQQCNSCGTLSFRCRCGKISFDTITSLMGIGVSQL